LLSLGEYRHAADLFRLVVRSLDEGLTGEDTQSGQASGPAASPGVLARAYLVQSLADLGEFDEGITWGEDGVRLAEALGDPLGLAYACMRLGRLYQIKGELAEAARLLERSCALSRDWQITFTKPIASGDLGLVYAQMGRVADGVALLRDAIDVNQFRSGEVGKPRLHLRLGEACLLDGQLDEARAHAEGALTLTRARGDQGYEARALRLLADVAAHADTADVTIARAHYRQTLTLATALGMRPLVAHCHSGLAKLYCQLGNVDTTRQHLRTAGSMFRELKMPFWLEELERALGILREHADRPS
jgi:tetratricopeptide (TPR) repeat protein